MPNHLPSERLNRVATILKDTAATWEEGVSLERESGVSIQQILIRVAVGRWRLADSFRKQANKLVSGAHPLYRSAISRYYYSMYHAVRACVYLETKGDDYQQHSELPKHIPPTLDPAVNWRAKLKNARLTRNSADYDAFPQTERAWKTKAVDLSADATALMAVTKQFLINKGCSL